jgi:sulfopyruvate decarboxylase subunit beta
MNRVPHADPAMHVTDALRVLPPLRGEDAIVVSHMGAAREWIHLSDHPLDLHYVPSAMGGGPPLALGLALAQSHREVWLLTGDGSLLMTLGALVTVVDSGAENLTIVLIDNAAYEIIGGPKTPATRSPVDFAAVARACGLASVTHFRRLEDWRANAAAALALPGPRFIWLEVDLVHENHRLDPPCPMEEQLVRFRRALGTDSLR